MQVTARLNTTCRQQSSTACMRHCSASAGNDHGNTAAASSSERLSCFWNYLARVAPRQAGQRCRASWWMRMRKPAAGQRHKHHTREKLNQNNARRYRILRVEAHAGGGSMVHPCRRRISWFGCSSVSHHTRRQRPTYQVIPSAMCSAARKRSCGGPCISRQSRRQVYMSEELRLRRRVHDRACAQPFVPNTYLPLPSFAAA